MSCYYDSYFDPYHEYKEKIFFEDKMEEIREKTIEKLSKIELSAIFEDFEEFIINYKEELKEISIQHRID